MVKWELICLALIFSEEGAAIVCTLEYRWRGIESFYFLTWLLANNIRISCIRIIIFYLYNFASDLQIATNTVDEKRNWPLFYADWFEFDISEVSSSCFCLLPALRDQDAGDDDNWKNWIQHHSFLISTIWGKAGVPSEYTLREDLESKMQFWNAAFSYLYESVHEKQFHPFHKDISSWRFHSILHSDHTIKFSQE